MFISTVVGGISWAKRMTRYETVGFVITRWRRTPRQHGWPAHRAVSHTL